MKRTPTFITLCILTAALCACSAVPKVATPDGAHRMPVNTQSEINAYQANLSNQGARPVDQAALVMQIEAMKREIAELKQLLASEAKTNRRQVRQVKVEGSASIKAVSLRLQTKQQRQRQRPPTITVPALAVLNRSTS